MEKITDSTHFTTSNKSASKKHHNIVTYNDLFKTPILYKEFYDRIEFTRAPYLIIYNKYIVRLQVYYTYYLSLTVPKVSQNGAYFVTPEKTQSLSIASLSYEVAEAMINERKNYQNKELSNDTTI
jgi:hypothetical protein